MSIDAECWSRQRTRTGVGTACRSRTRRRSVCAGGNSRHPQPHWRPVATTTTTTTSPHQYHPQTATSATLRTTRVCRSWSTSTSRWRRTTASVTSATTATPARTCWRHSWPSTTASWHRSLESTPCTTYDSPPPFYSPLLLSVFILLTFTLGGGNSLPSLPFRPLRSRPSSPYMWAPHCGYRGSGDKLSQRVRPPSVFWCILDTNLHPFDCLMTNNFLFLLSIKKFPWYTCNSLSQPKTIEHTIFWRRGNSHLPKKDAWNIHCLWLHQTFN